MALPRKVILSGAATAINVAGGLARNKILAAFLTVGFFGLVSISQQALSLAAILCAVGFPLGIVTYTAGLAALDGHEQRRQVSRIVWAAACHSLVLAAVTIAVLLWRGPAVARALTGDAVHAAPVALILLAVPFLVMELCLYSVMEGLGRLTDITLFKTVPVLVGLPVLYLLVRSRGLMGAAAGILVQEVLLVLTALWVLRSLVRLDGEARRARSVVAPIVRVAALSFAAGASWLAVDFLVKRGILALLGPEANGFVQGVTKVTDIYPNVALAWLTMHLFPTLAALPSDRARAAAVLERTLFVALSLIIPIILVLFAGGRIILPLIYRAEFFAAVPLFRAMLATGVLKVLALTLTLALLPLGLRREWIIASMLTVVLYALGMTLGLRARPSTFMLPVIQGAVYAAAAAYCLAALHRRGYPTGLGLTRQAAFAVAATLLLVVALFRPWVLVPLAGLYAWHTIRHRLWIDVWTAWRRYRGDS